MFNSSELLKRQTLANAMQKKKNEEKEILKEQELFRCKTNYWK